MLPNIAISVSYKFLGFPKRNVGVVAIRGTYSVLDTLIDAQLWGSVALAQYIRAILPLGSWMTSIIYLLDEAVSLIESKRLAEIAYYKETHDFVKEMKKAKMYKHLIITGHCKCLNRGRFVCLLCCDRIDHSLHYIYLQLSEGD